MRACARACMRVCRVSEACIGSRVLCEAQAHKICRKLKDYGVGFLHSVSALKPAQLENAWSVLLGAAVLLLLSMIPFSEIFGCSFAVEQIVRVKRVVISLGLQIICWSCR